MQRLSKPVWSLGGCTEPGQNFALMAPCAGTMSKVRTTTVFRNILFHFQNFGWLVTDKPTPSMRP